MVKKATKPKTPLTAKQ